MVLLQLQNITGGSVPRLKFYLPQSLNGLRLSVSFGRLPLLAVLQLIVTRIHLTRSSEKLVQPFCAPGLMVKAATPLSQALLLACLLLGQCARNFPMKPQIGPLFLMMVPQPRVAPNPGTTNAVPLRPPTRRMLP